jgi:hypothetical protein
MEEVHMKGIELLLAMPVAASAVFLAACAVERSKKSGTVQRAIDSAKLRGVGVAP